MLRHYFANSHPDLGTRMGRVRMLIIEPWLDFCCTSKPFRTYLKIFTELHLSVHLDVDYTGRVNHLINTSMVISDLPIAPNDHIFRLSNHFIIGLAHEALAGVPTTLCT